MAMQNNMDPILQRHDMSGTCKKIKSQYRTNVMQCRLRAGIPKQKDLARLTGIPAQTISELESNKKWLTSAYGLAIAEACHCSLDDLFERRPEGSEGA